MANLLCNFKKLFKLHNAKASNTLTYCVRYYWKKELNHRVIASNKVSNQFYRRSFSEIKENEEKEMDSHISMERKSSVDPKLLKIAIIGAPNSGKSTLINKLIGWRVCSVSSKVHTTQCNARAIYNDENTQLVFLDTPGIVSQEEIRKYRLKQSLVVDPELCLQRADIIAVLHDVSNKSTCSCLHPRILRLLTFYYHIPSILILNKVDKLKKKDKLLSITNSLTDSIVRGKNIPLKTPPNTGNLDELLSQKLLNSSLSLGNVNKNSDFNLSERGDRKTCDEPSLSSEIPYSFDKDSDSVEIFLDEEEISLDQVMQGEVKPSERQVQKLVSKMKGWPGFSDVFMISALEGSGVRDLKHHLLNIATPGKWIFSEEMVTDQSPQEIALLAVREKCLEYYSHNIPYELKFRVLHWELTESDLMSIFIGITCRNKSHMKLLIGPSGRKARKISMEAEQELRNTFRTEVKLKINFMLERENKP